MTEDDLLRAGPMRVLGRLPDSSNNALLCSIDTQNAPLRVVYKPQAGEQPLWDFPTGTLCRRERAAALLDELLGWGLVPPTQWRETGPAGPGVVQQWVQGSIDIAVFPPRSVPQDWIAVLDAQTDDGPVVVAHRNDPHIARMIVFDAVANNADRKGGHLLRTDTDLFGIDHGVTFHVEPKLRTVLWGMVGAEIPRSDLHDLQAALDQFEELGQWLQPSEVNATRRRAKELLDTTVFPAPSGSWPAVPWPLI